MRLSIAGLLAVLAVLAGVAAAAALLAGDSGRMRFNMAVQDEFDATLLLPNVLQDSDPHPHAALCGEVADELGYSTEDFGSSVALLGFGFAQTAAHHAAFERWGELTYAARARAALFGPTDADVAAVTAGTVAWMRERGPAADIADTLGACWNVRQLVTYPRRDDLIGKSAAPSHRRTADPNILDGS